MIVPPGAVDAQSLIARADLVVSAGGTMNREAVALGTPVYSTFAGRLGGVDEQLIRAGRLRMLADEREIELVKQRDRREVARRDPAVLADLILGTVASARHAHPRRQARILHRRRGERRAAPRRARARSATRSPRCHAAGVDVVIVTSGAIARGMRLLELALRPRAIEDLQAASAVGQGKLYRVYDELLRDRGLTSAQVLLTFFDMSARTHYLNARRTLRKLLDWRVVPVINENDTTTTDEISFGDNDFLAAQVAVLTGADLLVLLTDTGGLYTADPRIDPAATLVDLVEDPEALGVLEIGHATSPLGSGGMRSKVVAAEMATAAGISTVIGCGLEAGVVLARLGGRADRHALRATAERALELQAVAEVREAGAGHCCASTRAPRGRCARAARRCCPSASSRCGAGSTPATRSRSARRTTASSARGSATTRPSSCAG